MKRSDYIIMLGIAAAAGAAVGMLTDRKNPAKGGLLGAAAAVVAGSVTVGVYHYRETSRIPYYSSASPLYEEPDLV